MNSEMHFQNTKKKIFFKKYIFFLVFLNIFENNLYMFKRELPAKRHYFQPVCNITCPNLY